MTDKQLEGLGAQAANMAKRDMEQREGGFHFLLATYHDEDKQLHRMTRIEALIVERLGENWLNNGRAKDIGFGVLRIAIDHLPPDAVIFATIVNRFTPTAAFRQLSHEQQTELLDSPHNRHHEAVREGLLEVCDALTATVQTPSRVCFYWQNFAHGQPVGKPETTFANQDQFDGRLKMFGKHYALPI